MLEALTPRTYEPGGQRPGGWAHRVEPLPDARSRARLGLFRHRRRRSPNPSYRVCARLFVELNLLEECVAFGAGRAIGALDDGPSYHAAKVELLWAFGHAAMFTERNSHQCEAALRSGLELAQAVGDLQNQFRLLSRLLSLCTAAPANEGVLLEVALLADTVATKLGDTARHLRAQTYLGIAYHLER